MYDNKKILALIPARGGSKGIKGKNIYPLRGKPLLAYTIESAIKCSYIDEVLITTDSEEIADTAKKFGASVPFLRPDDLSGDKAKTIDAVLHAVSWLKQHGSNYDVLVLLQPTSPLRSQLDISNAIEKFFSYSMKSLASVCEVNDNPILIRTIHNSKMSKLLDQNSTVRRQDMEKYYRINGSIYINSINELDEYTSFNDNEISYIMPVERSVDIDTEMDIRMVEIYMQKEMQSPETS